MRPRDLKKVSVTDLKAILRFVHRGELSCPLDPIGLAVVGLLRLQDDVEALAGLDEAAVRSVISCVLAERGSPRG